MITYVHVPEKKKTIAILDDAKYSAVDKICKIVGKTRSLAFNPGKYLMNSSYRAVVVCHGDDEYNPEEGERQAKKKLLDHYYEQLDKKLDAFSKDVCSLVETMIKEGL